MTTPRWLRPWHPASGAAFGYLFGYAVWLVMLAAFALRDGGVSDEAQFLRRLGYGLIWAIPWSVLWCISGALCQDQWRYPGTVVTSLGIVSGAVHSLIANPFDGWLAVILPVYAMLHCVAVHIVVLPVWLLVWWIRGEGEDDS